MTRRAAAPKLTGKEVMALMSRTGRARIRNIAPKEQRTYNGHVFHSKAEAKKAAELDLLVKCGDIVGWLPQIPYVISVNDVYICTIIVDFKVFPKDGKEYLLEIKGMESEVYKLKRKLFKACHPDLDYRVEKV